MRRALCAAIALVMLLAGAARPDDLDAVTKRGALRVLAVVIDEEPQFLSLKAGRPPGFDYEMLDGFAKLRRIRIEIVRMPSYDALIPALLKGKGDVIAGGFTATEPRRKLISFTEEAFPTRNVVYTRKPHKVVQDLEELKAEKVGTYKGTSMADDLAAAGVPAASIDDTIELGGFPAALKAGRITAAVDGIEAALTAKAVDPDLHMGIFLGKPEALAYGVAKADAKLFAALNDYLVNTRKTQTWSRLVVKYFGAAAPEILKKARESR